VKNHNEVNEAPVGHFTDDTPGAGKIVLESRLSNCPPFPSKQAVVGKCVDQKVKMFLPISVYKLQYLSWAISYLSRYFLLNLLSSAF
jgi:hypothetical protein